jgi:hypothetical protein
VVPRQLGEQRVRHGRAAHEIRHHAPGKMLVDELTEMTAAIQHASDRESCPAAG